VRTTSALTARFEALAIRKGHKKSIVSVAYKLMRIIYAMLSQNTHYQDRIVDYEP
jgi:hypothetical protein